jgi:hypothetical protein
MSTFWRPLDTAASLSTRCISGSVALDGPQTISSSLQGGLSAKATPEPNTYRSNLRSLGSQELRPIGLTYSLDRSSEYWPSALA